MFSKADENYLKRLLGRNEVVLFLGSGFSRDCINKSSENFPTGWLLGEKIWKFLNMTGNYDGTSLPEMYQAFLNSGKKRNDKTDFLQNNLLASSVPDIYDNISEPFWYKIYTLNIDDVLDHVYRRSSKQTQILKYPVDEFKERDQSLEKTQIVYLHGKLPSLPEDVIFSTKQYARAGLVHQPLYSQFIYDYATTATIFVGTDLNEDLFESYIEARQGKAGYGELRPKSFLITPSLSPIKKENFKSQYNVHHISGTTEDFLKWLQIIKADLPKKNEILRTTFPNLLNIYDFAKLTDISSSVISSFALGFERVPREFIVKSERSAYLLGANPTWNDLYKDFDIPRDVTNITFDNILKVLQSNDEWEKQKIFTFLGSAGAGKTTILKRLGLRLTQSGYTVFLCNTDFLPRTNLIFEVLKAIDERVVIVFDNAKNLVKDIPIMVAEFAKLKNPPVIILGLRKNFRHKLEYYLDPDIIDNIDIDIPDLSDQEITDLIGKLDDNNYLGVLKGLKPDQRFREFKFRAQKQILIAMKEATNGKSFNEIIKDEFDELEPYEAKMLCVCISLNTEQGFSNSVQDFVGFSKVPQNEALNLLNYNLNGILIWDSNRKNFMIRHRILADYIIKHCSDLVILKEAYIRVLNVLAPEFKRLNGTIRKFNLFKSLINHQIIYQRFRENITMAREVYDSVAVSLNDEPNYWLQYGSLEMTADGGSLALAENYISQAESLAPDKTIILSSKCVLYYKLSVRSSDYAKAYDYKLMADKLCDDIIAGGDKKDPYIYHIQCRGMFNFIQKWAVSNEEKLVKIKELRNKIRYAVTMHPRDRDLEKASNLIQRAYLRLGAGLDMTDDD
jgi:ABC-type cobalamin/Fe3+-siderophores transport system ATPase subunit